MYLEDNDLLNKNYPIYYHGKYNSIVQKYSKNILPLEKAPKNISIIQYHQRSLDFDLSIKVRDTLMRDFIPRKTNGAIIIKRKNRNISNYDELLNLFKSKKIELKEVYFEDMSFDEQMEISNESEIMIGVHGAGLTNLMFMKQESIVIEIDPFDWGFNCFEHLAKNIEMKNFKRICQPITKDKYIERFKVDVKNIEENLKGLL
jgi:capsular polysaccharide biosynthesis protein